MASWMLSEHGHAQMRPSNILKDMLIQNVGDLSKGKRIKLFKQMKKYRFIMSL
jgi:hypothetical protein